MISITVTGKYGTMEFPFMYFAEYQARRTFRTGFQAIKGTNKNLKIWVYESEYYLGKIHAEKNNLDLTEDEYEEYGKQLLENNDYAIRKHRQYFCIFELINFYKEKINEKFVKK